MSFGGAVSAMLTSLKNNKRPRVSAFEKIKGYEHTPYKKGKIEKKATPHQLKLIREKIQKENKRNTIIMVITFLALFFGFVLLFFWLKF